MTFKRKSSNAILPKLDIPPEHEALREETPPDLKGIQYTHLPKVGGRSSDDTSSRPDDDNESFVLLPAIGEPHPYPYVISAEVSLIPTPKRRDVDDFGKASEYFLGEVNFSNDFFEEFFDQLLEPHFKQIVSDATETKFTLDEQDVTPHPQKTEEIIVVENHDFVDLDDWLRPHIEDEIRQIIWVLVNDRVRLIQDSKADDANKKESKLDQHQRTLLYSRLNGDEWMKHEEQKLLKDISIDSIVNEMRSLSTQQKLMDNQILVQFQDDVISRTLASLILEDSLPNLEKGLNQVEEEEKRLRPIRM